VLVLTTHRKVGSLTPWLQQGASDVTSLTRPAQVQHALSRMIDESSMQQRIGSLNTELSKSEQRFSQLIRQAGRAQSHWRNNQLIACSQAFSDMTGLKEGSTASDWFNVFQPSSRIQLGTELSELPNQARAVVSAHGMTLRINREPINHETTADEQLISVKVIVDSSSALPAPETDSVSGLPARQTVVNKFQRLLHTADNHARYVAMMIDLSHTISGDNSAEQLERIQADIDMELDDSTQAAPLPQIMPLVKRTIVPVTTAVDRTLQDLAIYRAADRLSRTLSANTIVGRLSDDRLLIIRALEANEAPRMLAKGIRRSLGSLGGLLGSPEAVRINTVNVSASEGASAEGFVTRLENR